MYEKIFAIIASIVFVSSVWFLRRRHLHPISCRQPWLVVTNIAAWTLGIGMRSIPITYRLTLPCWYRGIGALLFFLTIATFDVRMWLAYFQYRMTILSSRAYSSANRTSESHASDLDWLLRFHRFGKWESIRILLLSLLVLLVVLPYCVFWAIQNEIPVDQIELPLNEIQFGDRCPAVQAENVLKIFTVLMFCITTTLLAFKVRRVQDIWNLKEEYKALAILILLSLPVLVISQATPVRDRLPSGIDIAPLVLSLTTLGIICISLVYPIWKSYRVRQRHIEPFSVSDDRHLHSLASTTDAQHHLALMIGF